MTIEENIIFKINTVIVVKKNSLTHPLSYPGGLPYMGYIGMCGHKGYGFSTFWS